MFPFVDTYSSWKNIATINLQPGFCANSESSYVLNEVNENKHVNELRFIIKENHIRPEAIGGGKGGNRRNEPGGSGWRRRGGKSGGRGRGGKRHQNFAARNRKIGKGGPTGRGAFSGLKRRRPTYPRAPDNSGSEPDNLEQDVDLKTGRTKRRQRPKPAEAEEKAKLRRDEDKVRKSAKKKRPGPKQKDKKVMKEKVKRFWRNTPKPKHKKAPKFITDGLESEKERENIEPEDFDDLRMPSKKQLKKLEKAKRKETIRRQNKRNKNIPTADAEERIIEGDYVPTLSEIEGFEDDFKSSVQDDVLYDGKKSHARSSPKLRRKLKPKKGGESEREYKLFQDNDLKRSPSELEKEYGLFLDQSRNFDTLIKNVNDSNKFYQEFTGESDEEGDNAIQSEHAFGRNTAYEENVDLDMNVEKTNGTLVDQDKYWSDYRHKTSKLVKKRSKLVPGYKRYTKYLDNLNGKKDYDKQITSSDGKSKTSLSEIQQLGDDQSDSESIKDVKVLDNETDVSQYDSDFNSMYEGIKEYINKETEIDVTNEKRDTFLHEDSDREKFSSDDYEVWDKVNRTFTKPLKKKKTRSITIKLEEDHGDMESKEGGSNDSYEPMISKYNTMHTENSTEESVTMANPLFKNEVLPEIPNEECSDHSIYRTQKKTHPDNDWGKPKNPIKKLSENPVGSDLMGRNIKQNLYIKDKSLRKVTKLDFSPTGSVVDEKLEALYQELKELSDQNDNIDLVDDVGHLLYNDGDKMFKLQGESSCDDEQNNNISDGDFNMKDYENYEEILPDRKFTSDLGE